MNQRGSSRTGLALFAAGLALLPSCRREKPAEVNPIVPKFEASRARVPLGSALEITYTWTLEPGAKKLTQDFHALVHFLDSRGGLLFAADHVPSPPVSNWEPGKTYSYTRTFFVPVYPYVGEAEVRLGLYPPPSVKGERVALKGEDRGMREYRVAKLDLLPQIENIFPVYKEGWHLPETHPSNPGLEHTWTKKEALISFKNPKKDVVVYLEADTCHRCFSDPPVLTLSVGGKAGIVIPIENSEVFLKKIHVKAADLGDQDWVDLRLAMNQSFIPKQVLARSGGSSTDDRELGLNVYHFFVGEQSRLGTIPAETLVEATPLPAASLAQGKGTPAKPVPVAKATPSPARPASPGPTPAPKRP